MQPNRATIEMDDKKRIAINDFERLIEPGCVGFYRSCEITQIFLHDKGTNSYLNFFALACFSEESVSETEQRFLSPKPYTINSSTTMGIVQFTVPISEAKSLFSHLQNGSFRIADKVSCVSNSLVLLPKQYVPQQWGMSGPPINNILRPNFYGQNYIIEFFDEKKGVVSNLTRKEVDKVFKLVKDSPEISVDLSSMYDRLGGIIFQFPITTLTCDPSLLDNNNSVRLELNRHPELADCIRLVLSCKASLDNVVTGFRTQFLDVTDTCRSAELEVGDSDNLELFLSISDSDILIYHAKLHFLQEFCITGQIAKAHAEPRKLLTSDSNSIVELPISSPLPIHIGKRRSMDYRDQIFCRVQENEIISNSGDYLVLQKEERKEALLFIRKKLQSISNLKEIGLWDPYLNVQDIIDTLYFETTGIPFRCITSVKGLKILNKAVDDHINDKLNEEHQSPITFEVIRQRQRELICQLSNNLGVRMEFRCQHGNYGYPFHDRFLILVPQEKEVLPIVYSLGSSVNSLGKLHHLIQKVTNPQVIFSNFDSLWNELQPEYCRILLFPNDLRSLEQ